LRGGIAITGVAFSARLGAVSPIARAAAFLLLPRLATSWPVFSLAALLLFCLYGIDIYATVDLFSMHEEDVQRTG
jgi:hypothetical protein